MANFKYQTGDYDGRKVAGLMTRLRNSVTSLDETMTEALIVATFHVFEGNANTITALWNETANDKRFSQFRAALRALFNDPETGKPWIKVKKIEGSEAVKVSIKGHAAHNNPLTIDGDNVVRFNAIPVTTWKQFVAEKDEKTQGAVKVGATIKRLLAAIKERSADSTNDNLLAADIAAAFAEYERRAKRAEQKASASIDTMKTLAA